MIKFIEKLLGERHTAMLMWYEPWPARGPEGNRLDAHIQLSATVHDCINLQREYDIMSGRPTGGDDARRLQDFISVHWATVVPNDTNNNGGE